jgi:hypothetical protein
MKRIVLLLLTLLPLTNIFGQDTTRPKSKYPFDNDTLTRTKLCTSFNNHKILAFETGEGAVIYVDENNIRQEAIKDTLNDWDYSKQAGRGVLALLDTSYKNADTTFIYAYNRHIERLISRQLVTSNAMVYDKKIKAFAPVIFHRLERILSTADRVFYFAGKRRFFRVEELIGVLPNEFMEIE